MMAERRRFVIFLLTLPLFAAGGAAVVAVTGASASGNMPTISQFNRQFRPDVLHIAVGTTVRIINDDNVTHHVYIDDPRMQFDSGEQPIGHTVDITFNQPGTFDVGCAIHPTMHLTVIVK